MPTPVSKQQNWDVKGKLLKVAQICGEAWIEGEGIDEPGSFVAELKRAKPRPDIFTFAQKLPETHPKYKYHFEWDNVAAIPITTYDDWWEKRLPQVTRKSVRRGFKRGVVVKVTDLDDAFVGGIVEIHNETLIKQGKAFAHHGKDFDLVKEEYGTFPERSEFLGAYYEDELIGLIKLVYVGKVACIMQIISKEKHYDKRPTNLLIAEAVRLSEKRGMSFLMYGKYVYGNKERSSLTEFKRRTGFEKIELPRYYVPLTPKGRVALRLGLHRRLLGLLPEGVISLLLALRSRYTYAKLRLIGPREEAVWQAAEGGVLKAGAKFKL